jgi:NAD(P)-dependent dehydrogenase (short-subunit alcohol dehydrogenase family)
MIMYNKPMLKEGSLDEMVIVVTGGGSGLGKAMTTYFLELGAKVVITSRNFEKLQKVKLELEEKTGGSVLAVQCDVRHYDQVEAMLKATLDAYGRVDGLLNNAAGNFISPTERLSSNAFDTIIDIVLKGTKNCTLAFGKHWIDIKQEKATVLNIVTTYAWTGSAYVVPSATAKAGV